MTFAFIRLADNLKMKFRHFADSTLFWNITASALLLGAMAAGIKILLPKTADLVSLHYNIYTVIDRVGSQKDAFIYPILGFLFFFVNIFLSRRFLIRGDKFISNLIAGFNTGILILLTLAIFYIIFLNL